MEWQEQEPRTITKSAGGLCGRRLLLRVAAEMLANWLVDTAGLAGVLLHLGSCP